MTRDEKFMLSYNKWQKRSRLKFSIYYGLQFTIVLCVARPLVSAIGNSLYFNYFWSSFFSLQNLFTALFCMICMTLVAYFSLWNSINENFKNRLNEMEAEKKDIDWKEKQEREMMS